MSKPDVNVFLIDFPNTKGREMCVANEDGSYTILINARLSSESQVRAYEHAMSHIENCDFEKDDVQLIEAQAHGLIPRTENSVNANFGRIEKWMEAVRKRSKGVRRRLDSRWRKNNLRHKMGFDFFSQEQSRLDDLTE